MHFCMYRFNNTRLRNHYKQETVMKKWQISTETWRNKLGVMMNLKYPTWILYNWLRWWRLVFLSFTSLDMAYIPSDLNG
jgi:hypothetical protein